MTRPSAFLNSILFFTFAVSTFGFAQPGSLQKSFDEICSSIQADVGITVVDLQTGDTLSIHGDKPYPMQSVFKFHIALAALRLVDEGKLSLDKKYHVTKDHYFKTWSVLMRKHPEANIDVTLRELIIWAVMNSDNVACDMLFDILGGPSAVEDFIKSVSVNDISIVATEREMHHDWNIQFTNWTTPNATARLLKLFYEGKILSAESSELLWKAMVETPNAPKRLKGMLPEGTMVARKPGTGDTNGKVYGAINDIGFLILPNGKKIIVAAYVTRAEDFNAAEAAIAKISRMVYDHYNK
jgi:beta-lactamase class A